MIADVVGHDLLPVFSFMWGTPSRHLEKRNKQSSKAPGRNLSISEPRPASTPPFLPGNVPNSNGNAAPPSTAPPTAKPYSSSPRPQSMLFAYTPPIPDIATENTLPELQPIFSFLNKHAHKTYHEGYLLKLNDLDLSEWNISCNCSKKKKGSK